VEHLERIAGYIIELTKGLRRTTPSPRDQPYFGLEAHEPLPVSLLAHLTAAGIFRKYEHVLELAGGLGATARWLARSHGCRVVGLARTRAEAAAASMLTARANLTDQVAALPADAVRLPLRRGSFTHVWSIDAALGRAGEGDLTPMLGQALLALRDGGLFTAQELVRPPAPPGGAEAAPWSRLPTAAAYTEALERVGFKDVRTHDVSDQARITGRPSVTLENARVRLLERIADLEGAECPYLVHHREWSALAAARHRGELRTYHFIATR
jgi:predicted O-methyltransferase YrrM